MSDSYPLPRYADTYTLGEYLKDLRLRCFDSQRKVGGYVALQRSTIARYESDNESTAVIPPDIGYVALLLALNVEKIEIDNQEVDEQFINRLQTMALKELNQIITRHYPLESKIREWVVLVKVAQTYLSNQLVKRQKSSTPENEPSLKPLLPHKIHVVGRKEELARVREGLNSRWPLIALVGFSGIGKTVLAIEIAYSCSSPHDSGLTEPFQAVVWISARGNPEQKAWFEHVLHRIAEVFKANYTLEKPLKEKQALINQLLQKHRTLLILDNFESMAEDSALKNWLLNEMPAPSKALLTSRVDNIESAWFVRLKGLNDPDAVEFIRTTAHAKSMEQIEQEKQQILMPLVRMTDGHPYAIELALGHIKHGSTLNEVVDHISRGKDTVEDIIGSIVMWAWQRLPEDNDARNLLLVIPFFTSRITRDALAAVSGLTDYRFKEALKQAMTLSLLKTEEVNQEENRYSVHPMLRVFLSTQLAKDPAREQQARQHWFSYYIDFLERRILRKEIEEPYWKYLGGGKLKSIGPEWPNLLNVLGWSDREQDHQALIELMIRLIHYMDRRAYHPVRLEFARKAAFAAHMLGHIETEALFHIDGLGVTLRKTGHYDEAIQEIKHGLTCLESLDPQHKNGTQLRALGFAFLAKVYIEQGNLDEAMAWITEAIALGSLCLPMIQHRVLVTAGDLAYEQKVYETAKQHYYQAIDVAKFYRTEGDTDLAGVYRKLGFCYLAMTAHEQAEKMFKEVISYKGQGGELNDIYATFGLAQVMQAKQLKEQAYRRALSAKKKLARLSIEHPVLEEIDLFLRSL